MKYKFIIWILALFMFMSIANAVFDVNCISRLSLNFTIYGADEAVNLPVILPISNNSDINSTAYNNWTDIVLVRDNGTSAQEVDYQLEINPGQINDGIDYILFLVNQTDNESDYYYIEYDCSIYTSYRNKSLFKHWDNFEDGTMDDDFWTLSNNPNVNTTLKYDGSYSAVGDKEAAYIAYDPDDNNATGITTNYCAMVYSAPNADLSEPFIVLDFPNEMYFQKTVGANWRVVYKSASLVNNLEANSWSEGWHSVCIYAWDYKYWDTHLVDGNTSEITDDDIAQIRIAEGQDGSGNTGNSHWDYYWETIVNISLMPSKFSMAFGNASGGPSNASATSVTINPTNPYVLTDVNCTYNFTNSTGGSGNDQSNITWYVNGIINETGLANETYILNHTEYTYNDVLVCEVFPLDGSTIGTKVNSSSATIGFVYNVTQKFNYVTLHNTFKSFNITLYYPAYSVLNASALFEFNGSNYTASFVNSTDHSEFYVTYIAIPNVTGVNDTLKNFTWYINYSLKNDFNFSYYNTTSIYIFNLDNCSSYTQKILNFTIKDANTSALVVGTIGIYFDVWWNDSVSNSNYSFTMTGDSSFGICMLPSWASFYTNVQLEYTAPGYATKLYYLEGTAFNNDTTRLINLLLENGTTLVTFTVTDINDDPVENVKIKVLAYDLPTNTYQTTEILNTDSDGIAYGQIILYTQWYKFILEYDGEVVKETVPTKIVGTSVTFRINIETPYFERHDQVADLNYAFTFTNATKTFSFTWSDSSGQMSEGCIRLIRRTINGDTELNDSCVTSAAGTILSPINENVSGYTYIATAYITYADGKEYTIDTLSISYNYNYRTWGLSGLFFSLLIIIALVFVGIWNPAVAVVFLVCGVAIVNIMGLFFLNWSMLITFVILGGITVYRLRR